MTRLNLEPTRVPPDSIILLAEDDPNQVFLFQEAVRKASLNVALSVARDGEEAVLLLGCHEKAAGSGFEHPTLLLLDLNMPGMDGFEVLAWVKRQPEWAWLPIVIWSSSEDSRDIECAYRLGADIYLSKPTNFEALVQLVTSLHTWCTAWDRLVRFRPQAPGVGGGWPERLPAPVKDVVYE